MFFFFMQKTAYEMRIIDWSSDVCSSDLIGVVFITLEDETGIANVIDWPRVFARFRRIAMGAGLIRVDGRMQREGAVIHVLADRLVDLSDRLWALVPRAPQPGDYGQAGPSLREGSLLRVGSRDFH